MLLLSSFNQTYISIVWVSVWHLVCDKAWISVMTSHYAKLFNTNQLNCYSLLFRLTRACVMPSVERHYMRDIISDLIFYAMSDRSIYQGFFRKIYMVIFYTILSFWCCTNYITFLRYKMVRKYCFGTTWLCNDIHSSIGFTFSGNEYVSNLPLQMALYFNAFFSPFWLVATLVVFEVKVRYKL